MVFSLFPRSGILRLIYMTMALLTMLRLLVDVWGTYRTEKQFADHAVQADVFLFNGYRETDALTRDIDPNFRKPVTAKLGFHESHGETLTITQDLEPAEIDTLKAGGTLHVQYLPEAPKSSARLEGHKKSSWVELICAALLAIYAFALVAPPAPTRGRTSGLERDSVRDGSPDPPRTAHAQQPRLPPVGTPIMPVKLL